MSRGKRNSIIAVLATTMVCGSLVVGAAGKRSGSPYHRLKLFAEVLSQIKRYYVEPVDRDELILGAVDGMVRTLDPHSSFMRPDDFKVLEEDTQGEFGGVGLEVGIQKDVLTVITPIEGSPAEKAGIEPGDRIIAIEKTPTKELSIEEAVHMMRGKSGTRVTATFERSGVDAPFDVELTREVIEVESVQGGLLEPGYPWIRVRSFQDGTTHEVETLLARLEKTSGGLRGILLDLRRNPGGVLNEAVLLSDLFLKSGTIVTTRGKGDTPLATYRAKRLGTIDETPLVVLIDGASASAAEIVAGALQDHGRAMVVGMKSYGKGSVQSLIELGDGFGLKLTIARYFTPSGRSIQANGVEPDIVVASKNEPTPDPETAAIQTAAKEGELPGHLTTDTDTPARDDTRPIDDYQLRIALQLLSGLARQQAR